MDLIHDNSAGLSGLWRPTEREQQAYAYLLSLNDSESEGIVRGQFAVPFFQKSGLPDAVLGGIWQLADTDSKGHLTAQEFSVAMKLISLAQAHKPVALSNLKDEVQLPDMKGVDLSNASGAPGAGSLAGPAHVRSGSVASSVGWPSLMSSAGTGGDGPAEPVVSAKDKQQYKQIFEKSQPVDGAISGAAARALFSKTKLSSDQLASIWALADPHSEGKLRLPGFIVAMYYIRNIMSNRAFELPRSCPLSLWRSAGGDMPLRSPAGSLSAGSLANVSTPDLASSPHWDVTSEERVRYEQFFRNLDQQQAGYLSGDVPVNFFLKSKLPEAVLSKIWDLADFSRNGRLNVEEFSVSMHLINAQLAGAPLPDRLPATLVPPSMRRTSIASASLQNLSPTLRPSSAKDRLQMMEGLRRSTTFPNPPRGTMSASTGRSPAPLSPVADDAEVASLQSQLSHMEDVSRGLQTQRTTLAGQLAVAGSRKHELELKISALEASHDAETRVNQELQERLKVEDLRVAALQDQVAEASRLLAVVSAQRNQLEQDVHRVQTQQLAVQQKLRQAQEDAQQLSAEIAALEQQKKHMEQAVAVAQAQAQQQQEGNRELAERAEGLKGEVVELSQKAATQSQTVLATAQRESLSFDDVFGTDDASAQSPRDTAFGNMFGSPPTATSDNDYEDARTGTGDTTEAAFAKFAAAEASSGSIAPAQSTSLQAPSSIFAEMPSFGPVAETADVSSTSAFDSFGAHADDPFEEFLQSTAVAVAPRSAEPLATPDPRSVSSTPALGGGGGSGGMARAVSESECAKTNPTSPSNVGFGADFSSAFGMLPGSSERAIKNDMETFESNFPDISTLDIAAEVAQSSVATKKAASDEDLTFDSVFGPSD
ncbi:hypothetical protein GGI02_004570, partial [Coemansia sp. RSA 2322]